MLLHLEFYWIPLEGSLRYCERITFNATSIEFAIAHAGGVLESQDSPYGKANLCLIKDQDGQLIRDVWDPPPPVPRLPKKTKAA